jgi:hypothetical protein
MFYGEIYFEIYEILGMRCIKLALKTQGARALAFKGEAVGVTQFYPTT